THFEKFTHTDQGRGMSLRRLWTIAHTLSYYRVLEHVPCPSWLRSWIQCFSWKKTPLNSPAECFTRACEQLGPLWIKLAQNLATRPDLVGETTCAQLKSVHDALAPL